MKYWLTVIEDIIGREPTVYISEEKVDTSRYRDRVFAEQFESVLEFRSIILNISWIQKYISVTENLYEVELWALHQTFFIHKDEIIIEDICGFITKKKFNVDGKFVNWY